MIKVKDELEFHNWFKENYNKLGFEKILSYNKGFPDFIMSKNSKKIRVELETKASNFVLHNHDPKKVDLVICINKDIKLDVPVIDIKNIKLSKWGDKDSDYNLKSLILNLFKDNKILTSSEVSKALKINWNTAEKYLLELVIDGKIERIKKEGVNLWVLR